jgi:hypothetical protein
MTDHTRRVRICLERVDTPDPADLCKELVDDYGLAKTDLFTPQRRRASNEYISGSDGMPSGSR